MLGRMTVSVKFTRKNLDICLSLTLSVSSILAVPSTMVCTLRPLASRHCRVPRTMRLRDEWGKITSHTHYTVHTSHKRARARARVPCLLSPPQPQPPPWRVIFFLHAFPVAFVNVFLNFFFYISPIRNTRSGRYNMMLSWNRKMMNIQRLTSDDARLFLTSFRYFTKKNIILTTPSQHRPSANLTHINTPSYT